MNNHLLLNDASICILYNSIVIYDLLYVIYYFSLKKSRTLVPIPTWKFKFTVRYWILFRIYFYT